MDLVPGGANTLVVTPFDDSGELDHKSMASLIDFVLGGGIQGIIALGTTGEFFTLSGAERVEVMRSVVTQVAGRVPVTLGVGADGTAAAVELARAAREAGADCVMVLPPLYFDQSPAAQIEHFTTVARSTALPVMLYDGAAKIPVPAEVVAEVAKRASNVRYVKLAFTDPERASDIRRLAPGVVPLAGEDSALLSTFRAGAVGSTIATGNIQPREVMAVHEAYHRGDLDEAYTIFTNTLLPAMVAISIPERNFIARFKAVAAAMGVIASGHVRSPLRQIDAESREELLMVMKKINVL